MASTIRSSLAPDQNQFKTLERKRDGKGAARDNRGLRRTPLRRQSKKRADESKIYSERRKVFLEAHPECECTWSACFAKSVDVHHKRLRTGQNFLNEKTWMALCRAHHNYIHNNAKHARMLELLPV